VKVSRRYFVIEIYLTLLLSISVMALIPSFRDSVTKWLNPEAKMADLGEGMQAYYDADKKVWVFPGDDPAELAKPIGPPPITPVVTASSLEVSPVLPGPTPKNDPLSAMMMPPTRIPSAQRAKARGTGKSPSIINVPGKIPHQSSTPTFAVFAPTLADVTPKNIEE
jgi:hypothetical protein